VNEEKKILIGPRSALFCPIPKLSWIIVDEEHEAHFKQEEKLKYHGRDAAIYLAKCLNIPIVLGSATPSVESWWNGKSNKYLYHSLKKRVFKETPPKVEVVDMKKNQKNQILPYWLSEKLYKALTSTLENKSQAALFLNRRGESSYIFCPACSYHFSCVNCDISLTQHKKNHLICHYCGFRQEKPKLCPHCKTENILSFGIGTASLQKELQSLFPFAHIARADRDEITTHKQWTSLIQKIEKKQVDIIIGTQMIAKGLDFPYLHLVGFILADQGLNFPDFRATEKSFQLISQMAGRSGRRKEEGQVILQTYNPSHPAILKQGNYEDFVKKELQERKKHLYPPFGKLSLLRIESISEGQAKKTAFKVSNALQNINNLNILGPAPAPHFRLKNKYRYHILLKSKNPIILQQAGDLIAKLNPKKTKIHINKDPVYMF